MELYSYDNPPPRCPRCQDFITSVSCVVALNKFWHTQHFCCSWCDVVLSNSEFLIHDSLPFCNRCYDRFYTSVCEACKTQITADQESMVVVDKHWHADCFRCCECGVNLVKEVVGIADGKLYCEECCTNTSEATEDGGDGDIANDWEEDLALIHQFNN